MEDRLVIIIIIIIIILLSATPLGSHIDIYVQKNYLHIFTVYTGKIFTKIRQYGMENIWKLEKCLQFIKYIVASYLNKVD